MLHNIEPLELPVRRFFTLIRHILFDGLNEENAEVIKEALESSPGHPWLPESEKPKQIGWTKDERGKPIPPPGWTPPGWKSDSEAYRIAQTARKGLK